MKEKYIHEHICTWLKLTYPRILFRTDFAAGVKMSMGQAIRHKKLQSGRAWPDLFIAEPKGGFHGLFLEIKGDEARVFNKKGHLLKNQHLIEQGDMIALLRSKNYAAYFAVGFDQARDLIQMYLEGKKIIGTVL